MQKLAARYIGNRRFSIETVEVQPPSSGEVQIEVAWCGICGTDMHVFHGAMDQRVGNQRIIGHEMSGIVRAVGSGVSARVGEKVVVRPLHACGECPACRAGLQHICHKLKFLGLDTDGGMQQVWNVPAEVVHKLPDTMPLDQAALIEPLAVACHDVRRARLVAGETVLVIGGGPIGLLIGMVAARAGGHVFLSDINPSRLEMAAKLGLKPVNARESNVAQTVLAATGDKGADVVFEVSGTQQGVDTMTDAAAARGRIVMVAIHSSRPTVDLFRFFWREIEMLGARVYEPSDYEEAIRILAEGELDVMPLVTDRYPLTKIQDAFEALDGNPTAVKTLLSCQTGN